ncbi:solute carrier family 35 member D2-like protein isoform X3 [Nerophis lumbriciformis]|uniref:solute carrier family 35 member D2-like protein isoform X3 n=1 Tax=Nerophis lumbriciformis TaxID=546530 RepID=UPI002AE077A2|nr:solute carrier family 35 member D2-like protein isoform X3 [Nerophis lumbriciformis]
MDASSQKQEEGKKEQHSAFVKLTSALFYAASSLLITVVNKSVLTSFRFPSYMCLGVGQMLTTLAVLQVAKMSKKVHFQDFDSGIFWKVFPLPLLYMGNHITGLASTKKLSLPMFTVLRKFTILMTMTMEVYLLRKTFPRRLVYSVVTIVFGAVIAASSDLAFDVEAYAFILVNDVFTAASNVYTKMKIGTEAVTFEDWVDATFVFCFLLSCIMGFVLMYSIVLCSYYNSALTTTVVGAVKNVAVAFIGMFVGGDYLFSWNNFLGLSICLAGGLAYSYLTFNTQTSQRTNEASDLKILAAEEPSLKTTVH